MLEVLSEGLSGSGVAYKYPSKVQQASYWRKREKRAGGYGTMASTAINRTADIHFFHQPTKHACSPIRAWEPLIITSA